MAHQAHNPEVLQLENLINYQFNDPRIALEALQSSGNYGFPEGCRRLAMIGDAVLRLSVLTAWYPTNMSTGKWLDFTRATWYCKLHCSWYCQQRPPVQRLKLQSTTTFWLIKDEQLVLIICKSSITHNLLALSVGVSDFLSYSMTCFGTWLTRMLVEVAATVKVVIGAVYVDSGAQHIVAVRQALEIWRVCLRTFGDTRIRNLNFWVSNDWKEQDSIDVCMTGVYICGRCWNNLSKKIPWKE